ncbi:MAG: hypothetical protein HZA88_00535 [Verrucomicrobia bacterium]|nr:hypothetical protein [Verrucomicrobiota bacterium]
MSITPDLPDMKSKKTEIITLNMVIRPNDQSITAREFELKLRRILKDCGIEARGISVHKSTVRKPS